MAFASAFGSAFGSAAAGGGLSNMIGNANGFHMWEADNNFYLDPLGVGLGKVLQGSEKSANKKAFKNAQKYAELNYRYMLRSAREMPSATRAGLEAAGYNPLLALGSTGGASAAAQLPEEGFVHKDGYHDVNPLILSQLSNMAAEREATKARTVQTKVNTITDVLKTVTSAAGAAILAKQILGKKGAGLSSFVPRRGSGNLNGGIPQVINLTKEPSKVASAIAAVAQGAVASSASALPALGVAGAHYALGKHLLRSGVNLDSGANKSEIRHRSLGLGIFRKSPANNRRHN